MLISHEIPKQLFPFDNLISDYPYVLGHLLRKDKDYASFYKKRLQEANFSILDNSAFELGASIDPKELVELALEYKPKVLILPDTLHNREKTLEDSITFYAKYSSQLMKNDTLCMGVVQGNTFDELLDCVNKYHELGISYIAIPFDCIKDSNWNTVRVQFIRSVLFKINWPNIRFHFLGIQNPSELLCYTKGEKERIFSIDTSSPIINGWKGNRYTDYGLSQEKPKDKLAENLDIVLDENQLSDIVFNVQKFKEYATR